MTRTQKGIIIGILAVCLGTGAGIIVSASPLNGLPKQDKKITLTLSTQEVELILQGLQELPLKVSGNLYSSIMQQAQMQLQAQQKPVVKDTTKKKQ